jgi:hypothetical protein
LQHTALDWDRVAAESESTELSARTGTVAAVIVPGRRYRIRWDDGHTSIYTPVAGAVKRIDAGAGTVAERKG